ncbi:hypothetical protein [Faecalicoccus pleomorphus]|uniref:hypothetical protein n=1 Tax=Faecalicoccus pleomorphus TaxID=1323 RepID=UPI0039F51CA0
MIMDRHTFISTTLDRYGHLLDVDGDEILGAKKLKKLRTNYALSLLTHKKSALHKALY